MFCLFRLLHLSVGGAFVSIRVQRKCTELEAGGVIRLPFNDVRSFCFVYSDCYFI